MNNIPIKLKSLLLNANQALREKKYSEGKVILEKVFTINPKIFEVCYNLGLINLQLENFDTAIFYLEKAKKINPELSQVYFNLGLAYDKKKETNLAIDNFEKVVKLDPKNSFAFYNLGSIYQEIFRREEAEKNLKISIHLNPNYELAYKNLFDVYDLSNQIDKYGELLKKAEKIIKEKNILNFYYGIFEYKRKNFKKAIKILENIQLSENNFLQNIKKHGVLAKSYDHIHEFDRAFEYFESNNNLVNYHFGKNINEKIYVNYINQRIDFFENFKKIRWKNFPETNEIDDPIFLIGFPRSGTTLLDTILRTSETVEVIEEKPILRNFLIQIEKKTKNNLNLLEDLDNEYIKKMRGMYFQERKKYLKNKHSQIVIDKLPLNIIHIGEILRFFPNAKFILALRHPYDSVLSCFMQQFSLNPAMKNFLSIESSAYLYDSVMRLWAIYSKVFSINFHIIKYEDVVSDFEKTTKNIYKYLNIKWTNKTKDFYLTAKNRTDISTPSYDQITSPIYSKSIDRWKNYESKFKNSKKYLDKWVKQFQYNI